MEDIAVLEVPLPLVVGDSWAWSVVFWADPERRTPYDLTAKTVTAQIRWGDAVLDVPVTVTDAAEGEVTIALAADDTGALPLGRLSALYVDVADAAGRETWLRAPIEGKQGSVVWLPSR